jgi:hypothetical protein
MDIQAPVRIEENQQRKKIGMAENAQNLIKRSGVPKAVGNRRVILEFLSSSVQGDHSFPLSK